MTTAITKWGNSRGVRIPKLILDSLRLKESDIVELAIVDDTIVMKKTISAKSIEQRFEDFYGTDFETALAENPYDFPDVNWDSSFIEDLSKTTTISVGTPARHKISAHTIEEKRNRLKAFCDLGAKSKITVDSFLAMTRENE